MLVRTGHIAKQVDAKAHRQTFFSLKDRVHFFRAF